MLKFKCCMAVLALLTTAQVMLAADVPLPIKMADVAAQMNRKCPEHIKIEAKNDELILVLSEVIGRGGFEGNYSADLKRYAGHTVTLMIDVKADKLSRSDRKIQPLLGRIFFCGIGQNIHSNRPGWQTITFKGLRLPGNGLVKMKISLKNFSGEIALRSPRAKVNLLRRDRHTDTEKKKKDKKKTE